MPLPPSPYKLKDLWITRNWLQDILQKYDATGLRVIKLRESSLSETIPGVVQFWVILWNTTDFWYGLVSVDDQLNSKNTLVRGGYFASEYTPDTYCSQYVDVLTGTHSEIDVSELIMADEPIVRYECTTGGHYKFWAIQKSGNKHFITYWGAIGTSGQQKTKTFWSSNERDAAYNKLIADKLAKGYVLKSSAPKKPLAGPSLGPPKPKGPPLAPEEEHISSNIGELELE